MKMRTSQNGDTVLIRNMCCGIDKWIMGVIIAVKGPITYSVRCEGKVRYGH